MIHSLPVVPAAVPCETVVRRPHPRLREHVLSYSGFRTTAPIAHRMLPCNLPVLIIDITGAGRVVTGASGTAAIERDTLWGHGVTIGLTPAGVPALLGLPMRELTSAPVPLGPDSTRLAERLAAIPHWAGRFSLLEDWLTTRLNPDVTEDPLLMAAWWRLQRRNAPTVAAVAASLGVGRRRLETGFQRRIGLPPGTVARIARFQRAVSMVAVGAALPLVATESGYADQPHFTRDMRSMAGVTPTELRRTITAALPSPGGLSGAGAQTFKTRREERL
ncbi:helix-turn-helix domain-containing protein [Actinoplanes sp. GCM10030250]|uniref:AraC family transcriptional regulator n=1 Tax=Actinoplanes sp. GCM10030250 TaxID=3273376 RepID=UPI00361CB225